MLQQIDMPEKIYTSALAKGQGMVQETITLLDMWEPEMNLTGLVNRTLETNALQRATAKRAKDIIKEVFAGRYLGDNARPAKQLKAILNTSKAVAWIPQLFLVYTARANAIVHDFICKVYWAKYASGVSFITKQDALIFLNEAISSGHIPKRWSESMILRVSSYLLGCLADFDLIGPDRGGKREIKHFAIVKPALLYLIHDIHFSGYSDNSILEHADWCLFGFDKRSLLQEIERLSFDGHFIMQYAGDLLRISWKYKSMEECISVLA